MTPRPPIVTPPDADVCNASAGCLAITRDSSLDVTELDVRGFIRALVEGNTLGVSMRASERDHDRRPLRRAREE